MAKDNELKSALPDLIVRDLSKLQFVEFDFPNLQFEIQTLLDQTNNLLVQANRLSSKLTSKIRESQSGRGMIAEFKGSTAGEIEIFWEVKEPENVTNLEFFITIWHNLTFFWKLNAITKQFEETLETLPAEEYVLKELTAVQNKIITLSGELMRLTWLERANQLGNETIQKVYDYVHAIEMLSSGYDPNTYQHFKAS